EATVVWGLGEGFGAGRRRSPQDTGPCAAAGRGLIHQGDDVVDRPRGRDEDVPQALRRHRGSRGSALARGGEQAEHDRQRQRRRPHRVRSSRTCWTATAKLTPCVSVAEPTTTPTIAPASFSSGPPELPGLIGTWVWMAVAVRWTPSPYRHL